MAPEMKASGPASTLLSWSAARKVDSRASASGVAQGSSRASRLRPRWRLLRSSSERISRAQSSAPTRIHDAWARARSAVDLPSAGAGLGGDGAPGLTDFGASVSGFDADFLLEMTEELGWVDTPVRYMNEVYAALAPLSANVM